MSDDEKERIAAVEVKVDMVHKELVSFKEQFHSDFESHKKDDDENFKLLTNAIHDNRNEQTKTKTELRIYIIVAGAIIGPLIGAAIKYILP